MIVTIIAGVKAIIAIPAMAHIIFFFASGLPVIRNNPDAASKIPPHKGKYVFASFTYK